MNLNVLDNKFRIKIANEDFFFLLKNISRKSTVGKLNYQIINSYTHINLNYMQNIYLFNDFDIWFSHIKKHNRHIYVFGSEKPIEEEYKPFFIFDIPNSGINEETSAVFAQNTHGNVSLLYRINPNDSITKSSEIISKKDIIHAYEDGEIKDFISIGEIDSPHFIDNLIEFLKNIKKSYISNQKNDKKCEKCGNSISLVQSDNKLINKLDLMNNNLCKSCLEKSAADYVIEKLKKLVNITVFNKSSLLERVKDPDLYESYINLLVELGYLKELNKNLFILNKKKNVKNDKSLFYDINQSDSLNEAKKNVKECNKCGSLLTTKNAIKVDTDNFSDKCKECSRKTYAVKALIHLEEFVEPGISFNKNDLLKEADNKTRFLDYIWTLEDYDLLEKDSKDDYFTLKSEDVLQKFKDEYGEVSKESDENKVEKNLSKEKKSKKIIKECETCHQKLTVSKFYKTDEGYTDKCKECSRKSYAAKALIEIKKYVLPEVEFHKEDLLKQVKNSTQVLDYFWTLQDFDFILHNEKNNTYTLKPEKELNSFLQKYGDISSVELTDSEDKDENIKTAKECFICKKVLPISSFYKSSLSADGHTENCKKCTDELNAATILLDIKQIMGIGIPFSKQDITSKLNNPNKVKYYLWILLEKNLIQFDDSTDKYVIEDNETYQKYIKLKIKYEPEEKLSISKEDSEPDQEIISEDDFLIKHIIFISEFSNSYKYRTVVLRGIVYNNKLYSILEEIKSIITSNMTNMNFDRYKEDLIKIILELDIENEKFDETMSYLDSHNWKKF